MERCAFRRTGKAAAALCLLAAAAAWLAAACPKNGNPPDAGENMTEIRITIAEKKFTAVLENTPAAAGFLKRLPLTLRMNELNGNEKYAGLSDKLAAAPACPGRVRRGELMLYGTSTLVLFYESFQTSYRYTAIGRIPDAAGLKEALGSGNVTVKFEKVRDGSETPEKFD